MPRPRRHLFILGALLAVLAALCVLRLMIGSTFGWPSGEYGRSILQIRLTLVFVAIVAGVALSTSGVALQALLRNPLAEPFILGLAAGAAVGYIGQQMLSKHLQQSLGPLHLGALLGGMATLAVVYFAGRRRGGIDPFSMLLTGVVLSAFNGAVIMILYQLNTEGDMAQLARWMQGYLEESLGLRDMLIITVFTFAGLGVLLTQCRAMDVALFSDSEAVAMGVNLTRLRTLLFVVAALLASGAVVLAGPLAFVGFICPHIARLLFGPSHRMLLIASAILGALLIVLANTVMAAIQQRQFPVGVFTALVGGPVLLSVLRRSKR